MKSTTGASSGHHYFTISQLEQQGQLKRGEKMGLWVVSCKYQPWAAPPSLSHWVDQEFAVAINPLCIHRLLQVLSQTPARAVWKQDSMAQASVGKQSCRQGQGEHSWSLMWAPYPCKSLGDDLEVSYTNRCFRHAGPCSEDDNTQAQPLLQPCHPTEEKLDALNFNSG